MLKATSNADAERKSLASALLVVSALTATFILGLVGSARSAAPQPAQGSLVEVASAYLRESTGWNCQMRRLSVGPPLEEDAAAMKALDSLDGSAGWVRKDEIYAGSAAQAAAAFGGDLIASGVDEQWMVIG